MAMRGVRQSIPPASFVGTSGTRQSANPQPVKPIKQSDYTTKQWVAAFALPYISDGYMLANISGVTALPKGISFVANAGYLDYLFGNPAVQGNIIYRDSNANGWKALAPGTSGNFLQTQGAAANPIWANIPAASAIPNGYIISNISGASAIPIGNTLSLTMDVAFGNTQGNMLFRGNAAWNILAPNSNGNVLMTQGTGADPVWTSFSGLWDTMMSANGADQGAIPYRDAFTWKKLDPGAANDILISNGSFNNPSYSTLSALIDTVFGSAQGDILYRDSSLWKVLAPGTSGNFLQTQGAGANPQWASASGGSGYPKGTPPAVVQTAKSNASASVTFGSAPTNGNLMIAMWVSPTGSAANTGWTVVGTDTSGTDFSVIAWKKAGAGESTTQTPISGGNPTNCGLVVWELNGQNASQPIVTATCGHATGTNVQSGWTGANTWTVAHVPMDAGCIGLAMTGVASSSITIVQSKNVGTQDQASLSGVTRPFVAGHTDLGQTPTVGIILNWSGGNSDCKSMAAVITS